MSKIVFPLKAAPKRRWMLEFCAGVVRGFLTIGASSLLTVFSLLWLKANGYVN